MNTIVIGAGAAGLTAAIFSACKGDKVTIIEHMTKPGRKILVTGNGKCNISNYVLDANKYYGNKDFINKVITQFDVSDTLDFFDTLGIVTTSKNGYIYPRSEQAATVLNSLKEKALLLGVKIKANNNVRQIKYISQGFCVDVGIELLCDKLILATGGMSFEKTGSDGSGYQLAETLGHSIIEPQPALTAIKCKDNFLKKASGVRCKSKISVIESNKILSQDEGELQITDYGVSGIPVFNVSRTVTNESKLIIDFAPELLMNELSDLLVKLFKVEANIVIALNGLLNDKLALALTEAAGIDKSMPANSVSKEQLTDLCNKIKNYSIGDLSRRNFDFAQVTQGGVNTNEINPYTMESNIVNNLYFAGEIMDVDGICGGYNLQWAWSTGAIAGGFKRQ